MKKNTINTKPGQSGINNIITIISLWTRRFRGPTAFNQYDVEVAAAPTIGKMLQAAYVQTNLDGRPHGKHVCSTTTGDLMVLNGVYYLVAAQGFHQLTQEQADHEIVLANTLTPEEWATRNLAVKNQPGVPVS